MTKVTISSKADHTRTGQVAYLPAPEWPSILLSYNFLPVVAGQAGSHGHEVWNVVATSMSSDNYKCCFRASCNTTASPPARRGPIRKGFEQAKCRRPCDSQSQNHGGRALGIQYCAMQNRFIKLFQPFSRAVTHCRGVAKHRNFFIHPVNFTDTVQKVSTEALAFQSRMKFANGIINAKLSLLVQVVLPRHTPVAGAS